MRGAIATHVPATLHVVGEIGNLSRPGSGHIYLTLKDASAELRCVVWRSTAARLRFEPEIGMEVIATGGLEVYAQRGSYQLIARKLEPRGVGALEVAFRQLKERLERDGLFESSRKKPLPRIPQRVALVTSPTGAAIRDMLHTFARRFPVVDILVFPVRVQGKGAANEIATAIRTLNRQANALGGIDLLIVGRGGGSLEDLWAFNEEVVARAISASRIPVVSAVGHEVDVSISDLVADLRAPTPTAAAELVTPTLDELLESLGRQIMRVQSHTRHVLRLAEAEFSAALACDVLARPINRLRQHYQTIDDRQQHLQLAVSQLLRGANRSLSNAELDLLRVAAGARFERLGRALDRRLERLNHSLGSLRFRRERSLAASQRHLTQLGPDRSLQRLHEHLRQAGLRLDTAAHHLLRDRARSLKASMQAAMACDPRNILRRGFSIARDVRSRSVLRSLQDIHDKMRITIELADGEFRGIADDPRQPSLFD